MENTTSNNSTNLSMQKYRDIFIACLIMLLDIIKTKSSNDQVRNNSSRLIDAFSDKQINIDNEGSIIKKVYMTLDANIDLLNNNNHELFCINSKINNKLVKVTIIPAIDIGKCWNNFNDDDKSNIWRYLKIMFTTSVHMVNLSCEKTLDSFPNKSFVIDFEKQYDKYNIVEEFFEKYPNSTVIYNSEFNPYIGIGSSKEEYSVQDLLSGPELMPGQVKPSVEGISSLFGLGGYMEELSSQLKNITKEDIEAATNSIKKILGDNIDEDTTNMIDLLLTDISDELKKDDLSKGNPTSNIVKIAETVTNRVIPKINPKKINVRKIWDSTQNIAKKCVDKNGKPIFDQSNGKPNPFSMINKFMESQINKTENRTNDNNEDKEKSQEDEQEKILNDCKKCMSEMGFSNISNEDILSLSSGNLDKLFNSGDFLKVLNNSEKTNKSKKKNKNKNKNKTKNKNTTKVANAAF